MNEGMRKLRSKYKKRLFKFKKKYNKKKEQRQKKEGKRVNKFRYKFEEDPSSVKNIKRHSTACTKSLKA